MIKVLEESKYYKAECPCCGSKLGYSEKDIEFDKSVGVEYKEYIICPICEEQVRHYIF